jgi:oligopeptidase A
MTDHNPLLADAALPAFSQIKPEHVAPAIEALLADDRAAIDALLAPGAPRDFASVMLTQERLHQRLARAWAPVSHLHAVADTPA